jgi:hypothetical protein
MKIKTQYHWQLILLIFFSACGDTQQPVSQLSRVLPSVLPSWNDGNTKQRITDFVSATTTEGSPDFVQAADRIAVFDNDGTLWSEQPVYFQLAFAMDEVRRMAADHPEWKSKEPMSQLIKGDMQAFLAGGEKSIAATLAASHAGMTTEAFDEAVRNWMKTATHPLTGKHYNEMIYQPMVELLEYLRGHGYKTFIVSGGGVDFMRAWAEEAYGIPPYQIIGSLGGLEYTVNDSSAVLNKLPELIFNDDKTGKPVGIHRAIGKRPIIAVGNSDGDYQMLQYTTMGSGPRLGIIIHHTDSLREKAYDRDSHIGQLQKGLEDAPTYGWLVADMASDWKVVYAEEALTQQ